MKSQGDIFSERSEFIHTFDFVQNVYFEKFHNYGHFPRSQGDRNSGVPLDFILFEVFIFELARLLGMGEST